MHGKPIVRLLAAGFCMFAANIFAADTINARGGVLGGTKLELVLVDNKSSPQESLVVLKQAIDQDIRLVTQGVGSHVAHAMTDAVLKYNQRNPGRELLYLNNGFLVGTPRAFGAAGANRVKTVAGWNANIAGHPLERYYLDYKKRFREDFGFMAYKYFVEMLARAIDKAGSADPAKVAKALEDLRYEGGVGEVWMRADGRRIIMPLYVSSFVKAGTADVKYDADDTGYGWKSDVRIEAMDNILPTTCKMERP